MRKEFLKHKLNIYPKPQQIEYIEGKKIDLSKGVNLVINENHKNLIISKLKEVLEDNNMSYNISNLIEEDKVNITISYNKDSINLQEEGYVLRITDDENKNSQISIIGADESGICYGILTLGQILEQKYNDEVEQLHIIDYPEIKFRGFIEGFYGYPWSHEDRISLIKDTSKFKMNTYIYAPKDDPYHRFKWKELYPKVQAKEISELAKVCNENNMNFCWTIHPGDTLEFIDEDFEMMIAKLEQLYTLGVRQFGIMFDDTDDWNSGKIQAEWINRIDKEFVKVKGDIAPIIAVTARYNSAWGPDIDVYFKPFVETINQDIQVMWTGHGTMSNISKEVFEWPRKQTSVDNNISVWWNYPVNDYCDSKLLMAPMHNLHNNLNNVSGFFSNPMNQAEASKVALFSIADYTWNTDGFDYMKSWETSIEKLVPEVCDEFKRFAANTSYLKETGGASGDFEFDESWYLKNKVDEFKTAIIENKDLNYMDIELIKEFQTIVADCENIKKNINNSNLLKEIEMFLDSYKFIGEAGIAAIKAYVSKKEANIAKEKLELADRLKIERLKEENKQVFVKKFTVSVGTKVIRPMISELIDICDCF